MSTGIVSSKDGHDESHINDTKLGTKFWNIVHYITIGLTQITNRRVVLTANLSFFLPFNIGQHDEILANMTRPNRHIIR